MHGGSGGGGWWDDPEPERRQPSCLLRAFALVLVMVIGTVLVGLTLWVLWVILVGVLLA